MSLIMLAIIFRAKPGARSPLGEFDGILALIGVLGSYASFFWGCYNLAMAKGYPGALVLIGIFFGPLGQLGLFVGLLAMEDRNSSKPRRRRTRPHSHSSKTEYIVRCRRNAVLGIVFGILGIFVGIILVVFRLGIFQTHENEFILGMFIFLAGYVGVITGCWWWVKAKSWPDALLLIGLMPLGIFFIPGVRIVARLILRTNPELYALGMVMMPLILVVVIAVLPDKSGWAEMKRWRIREQSVRTEESNSLKG
ncbi:MAG TPA: hypothetical protein VFB72_04860 [Verrucomicrobiae bacterium]|nr:hypothetical protein [Verrucomicrobiae bacterium]